MSDYQRKMLEAYYAQIPRLQAENRRLRQIIAALFAAGTIQWVLCWFV